MPTASIQPTSASRLVYAHHATWATARNGAGVTVVTPTGTSPDYLLGAKSYLTATYWIMRVFLKFDLSSLPSASKIYAANLKMWVYSKSSGGGAKKIVITEGHHSDPVVTTDFDTAAPWTQRDDSTDHGSKLESAITEGQYNTIDFDASGLELIEAAAGGTLLLCIRHETDVSDTAPGLSDMGIYFYSEQETDKEPSLEITDYARRVWPVDGIVRITNIIHRYNRVDGLYMLEANLGEVTSDFGLPEWLAAPIPVAQEEKVSPPVGPALEGYSPEPFPDVKPGVINRYTEPFPDVVEKDAKWNWWRALTPWKEEKGETFISALQDVGRTISERLFDK